MIRITLLIPERNSEGEKVLNQTLFKLKNTLNESLLNVLLYSLTAAGVWTDCPGWTPCLSAPFASEEVPLICLVGSTCVVQEVVLGFCLTQLPINPCVVT